MNIRQLFHVKYVCKIKNYKKVLNWTHGLFGQNYRVATLSTFYLSISGIIIYHTEFENHRTILTCMNNELKMPKS